ncbi:unnamed protein product [[Candida] boidinii]|nr:unnamed protein product [[Candida] boidinii]
MDLSLISNPVDDSPKDDKSDASEEQQQQQINATATPLTTRSNSQPRLSIHNLMNSDSTNKQNDVPQSQSQSQSTPVPLPQTQSAFGTNNLEIRKRSCISNLTNNDDVDIEGNKIPNAISRVSVVSSESNNIHNNNIDISPSSKSVNSENNDLDNQINDNHNDNTHPRSLHDKIKELEDIEKIEKIKSSKPKRYTVKPIWARDFIPEFSKHKDSNNQQYKHNNNDYSTQTTENSMNNIDNNNNNSSSPTFSKKSSQNGYGQI